MNLDELNLTERKALEAALYLLINADGRVRHHERKEIDALAQELGDATLAEGVRHAGTHVHDVEDLVPLIAKVEREGAQELMRTILIDAANADGHRDKGENKVLGVITREWARR